MDCASLSLFRGDQLKPELFWFQLKHIIEWQIHATLAYTLVQYNLKQNLLLTNGMKLKTKEEENNQGDKGVFLVKMSEYLSISLQMNI